ncbi:MAG: NnrS family protein [Myxococcota bacterium]
MLRSLLSVGYRPFFLFCAVNAFAWMLRWLTLLSGDGAPTQGWPPSTLHAHEMIYGTAVAAIAGFLLTAVPNWTDTRRITGARLAGLVALWLLGRAALVLSDHLDPLFVAFVDVPFLPVLAHALARPILRSGKWHNYPVVGVLVGLAFANGAIHIGLLQSKPLMLRAGTYGAVYLVVMLMLVISGRVVPLFTRNALRRRGIDAPVVTNRIVAGAAVGSATAVLALDLLDPGDRLAAWISLLAGPLLLARQSGWQLRRVLGDPMLWILHLGHAWLALGFAAYGASSFWGHFFGAGAIHAFTAGAMGTLILGMMPRVALGHSGRAIEASMGTRVMFVLVLVGALVRVVGAIGVPAFYSTSLLAGGFLWAAAWLVFCVLYAKILVVPPELA